MKNYRGTIVAESLVDKSILNDLKVLKSETSPNLGWELYYVEIPEDEIEKLSSNIKSNKWYMHFWKDRQVKAVFKDQIFRFDYDNKETWKPAIAYGLSIGIPEEQLDFPIEE